MLLRMLPPVVHVKREVEKTALRWSVERMTHELRDRQPGWALVTEHLAHMMLVQTLRVHLADGANGGVGWLFALAGEQIGDAIDAIHLDPAFGWTVQALAQRAGTSRSVFAIRFKRTVGMTPMEYLSRWRMMLAGDKLLSTGDPNSIIGLSLGYKSESAFSTAFRRVMGCSPRQYSRRSGTGANVSR